MYTHIYIYNDRLSAAHGLKNVVRYGWQKTMSLKHAVGGSLDSCVLKNIC